MERLNEKLLASRKAVASLHEALEITKPSAIERDASIKRFELAFEATWKAAKEVLLVREGLDVASPKSVIRACREVGLFDDSTATKALLMADDRNLALHTYNEALAMDILSRLKSHYAILDLWVAGLSK